MTRDEAFASDTVVTGTLLFNNKPARVLFDSGATHSFVAADFAAEHKFPMTPLGLNLSVNTPSGTSLLAHLGCKDGIICIGGKLVYLDAIVLDIKDYDIILGMDWLGACNATIDCAAKTVTFRIPGVPEFCYSCGEASLVQDSWDLSRY
ncbi:retroviral-like aspartic protease family protein [Staphylococcus aureus]